MFNTDRYLSYHDFTLIFIQSHRRLSSPIATSSALPLNLSPAATLIVHLLSPLRVFHNWRFCRRELHRQRHFFDTVAKFPLGASQRRAVMIDEDNHLVVAGAGSGKTFTIVAKIKYLTAILGVDPAKILAISFTHKSAAELTARIATPGVKSCTFHALGLEILRTALGSLTVIDSATRTALLKSLLNQQLSSPAYVEKFHAFGLPAADFLELASTFLSLLKSSGSDPPALPARLRLLHGKVARARAADFLVLFGPFYEAYRTALKRRALIDFSDMIAGSTAKLNSGAAQARYDYVIIDEFQDLSLDRYLLLMALRRQNPALKFFCVGDDWQSIYRFAGSDSTLFGYFADYFGPTALTRIETTYRFGPPLLTFSSRFILQNPTQLKKRLKSVNKTTTLHCIYSNRTNDDTNALKTVFDRLITAGLTPTDTIFILGRYGFDFQRIKNTDQTFIIDTTKQTVAYARNSAAYSAAFLTIHKSKGLEADYIIILNCNSGAYGFPAERTEQPILSLLLARPEFFPFSEERRLFYVAITRARRATFLIAERSHPSSFFLEALNFRP